MDLSETGKGGRERQESLKTGLTMWLLVALEKERGQCSVGGSYLGVGWQGRG